MTKTKTILQNINQDEKEVMSQIKAQDKIPGKQLNEVETGNVPEKQFRIMIVKMIQDLGKTVEKMQEMFTKDLEELRDNQPQMNNTVGGINWITEAEELINDPEDRMVEITAIEQNTEKKKWRESKRPKEQH